jgi:hypothetical protein
MPGPDDTYQSYGLPWAGASNTPFRRYKHWTHEGGIASPLIAHWPSGIAGRGKTTHQPGHLIDVMATCLDLSGTAYPTTRNGRAILPFEGETLRPILEGGERPEHHALFWEHEGNRAVRQGKRKLVSRYPGPWELYDLDADRTELHDLAKQEDRLVDAIADGLIEREAAQRKSARIKSRRLEIYAEIDALGRVKEARQRALQYVQMARTEGIGTLVLKMRVEDKRKFFRAAFKTITLDGQGRGTWRKRSVKAYELSEVRLNS